mmetsp:Transcript_120118/g.224551  ORF Transcript_120118/g.224551 Transcript_120118/m.224551 type:complete len:372 (-) Transcript_120118:67-1182(-)
MPAGAAASDDLNGGGLGLGTASAAGSSARTMPASKRLKRTKSGSEVKDSMRRRKKTAATVLTANFGPDTDSEDSDYKPSSSDQEVEQEKHPQDIKFDVEREWADMQREIAADDSKRAACRRLSPLMRSLQGLHPRQPKDRAQKDIRKLFGDLNNYGRVYADGTCPAVSVREVKRQARAEEAAAQTAPDSATPSRPLGPNSVVQRAVACLNVSVSGETAKHCSTQERRHLPSPPRRIAQKASRNHVSMVGAQVRKGANCEGPSPLQKRKIGQEMSTVQKAHLEWKETRKTEDGLYNHRSVIEKEDFLARVARNENFSERVEHKKARQAAERAVFVQEDANKRLEIAKVEDDVAALDPSSSGFILLPGQGITV